MASRLALVQMTSTSSIEENLRQASDLVYQARLQGASMACLPESFDFLVDDPTHAVSLSSSMHSSPLLSRYHALASQTGMWLSLGGMHLLCPEDPSRIRKTHLILSPSDPSTPYASYAKTHLDLYNPANSPGKVPESASTAPGNSLQVAYDTPIGNVGLAVGTDLYYPGLFAALAESGANVVLAPAALAVRDAGKGGVYWNALMKARALDNQLYVAGAAQVGVHSHNSESWGQSMIVNPLGDCVADAGRMGPGIVFADLNTDLVYQVRQSMPVRKYRRDDLLPKINRVAQMSHM